MSQSTRRRFIKMLSMAAVASVMPVEKLTLPLITSNADMNIGVERMRITSSGNVGIAGGLPPNAKLHIQWA